MDISPQPARLKMNIVRLGTGIGWRVISEDRCWFISPQGIARKFPYTFPNRASARQALAKYKVLDIAEHKNELSTPSGT